ncbi:phosphatase PAP2 family protein [Xanthomonas sp. XNM01]|uniref:phosphatase PAP2 family protein n=1 Tax=Xanthomonas sp. XNM01 TaxID=2769289 RepID=UPI001784701A|nr:phosphatase PAP2 family protein [Xanthomonas sp. XNM01]MBD9368745.1 phosphatase PAP2 family protein [Xanthomonas sp. XNM01]
MRRSPPDPAPVAVPPHPSALSARDRHWCLRANRWGLRRSVRAYFSIVSRLGDGVFWYALMAVLAVAGGRAGWTAALHMAAISLVALTLYKTLKRWTRRPRPFAADGRIQAWVAPLDEFSFPSGHTLHAVSFTIVALGYFPMLALLLIPFTASVAVSRVVLGLHYPSDVLAATAIGSLLAGGSFWVAGTLPAVL